MYAEHLWCRHISQNRMDGGMYMYPVTLIIYFFNSGKSITLQGSQR